MTYKHEFKMTEGTARQEFRDGDCIGQEFIAGDEVNWENGAGAHVSDPTHEVIYQPFDMVQPDEAEKLRLEQRLAVLNERLDAVKEKARE